MSDHRTLGRAPVDGVVCFAAQDFWYHNRAHSDIQLMRRVARELPVLFVNSIGMRVPLPGRSTQPVRRIARKLASVARGIRRPLREVPGLAVFTPLNLPAYGSPLARSVAARTVRTQVALAARLAGIRRPGYFVTVPTAWDAIARGPRRPLIYNRSDRHSAFGEVATEVIAGMEHRLLANADRVLYVSSALMAADGDVTAGRARFLDHGVDLEHFDPARSEAEPADIASIPRPRIGFFGGIDDYVVDLSLIESTARALPDASIVLVGDATCPMDTLTALPNVHWLGYRPYESIPAYGRSFDVAIMPWLDNDWIQACNPIKAKEYLALGLPVVSTDYPEGRRYAEVMRLARGSEDFVAAVKQTLTDGGAGTPESRRAHVAGDSWDGKAAQVIRSFEESICAAS
ncbi:MAG: glycosyltransferase [Actinopolymorphaceae bacterium]